MNIKTQIYPFEGETLNKESEDIHIPGIEVGGGWRTGCGSHPQSAEQMEELEESVCSVVRQANEREGQGGGVQDGGKPNNDVRGRDNFWALKIKKVRENKLEVAEMRMIQCMFGE